MRSRLWLTILAPLSLVILQACGPKGPFAFLQPSYKAQDECGFVQNVYGERISWKGHTPIRLSVHQSFPQEYIGALQSAIQKWEQVAGKPLFQIVATNVSGPLNPRQDGVSMIYFMNTWEADRPTEQARTSIYWVGDELREADIRVNAANFTFYWQTPNASSDVHIESLLIHELGHALGLKHKDTGGSVMATYLSALTQRNTIPGTDFQALKCEY
jgi:hypothetical protein